MKIKYTVFLIPILVVFLFLLSRDSILKIELSNKILFANGISGCKLTIRMPNDITKNDLKKIKIKIANGIVRLTSYNLSREDKKTVDYNFSAGYVKGNDEITVLVKNIKKKFNIYVKNSPVDNDRDGIPDNAELRSAVDRYRFRKWFCAIAESQYYQMWDSWNLEQRDCSGLVRFAFCEALKKHDKKWFNKSGYLLKFTIPDVISFNYPNVPYLGTSVFRKKTINNGFKFNFNKKDFGPFVTARYILNFNTQFIGYDYKKAFEGDLFFYDQFDLEHGTREDDMHIMIFIGKRVVDGEVKYLLVYHTGDQKKGKVRKLSVETLGRHPDSRWHPVKSNKNFLGIYRFSILN